MTRSAGGRGGRPGRKESGGQSGEPAPAQAGQPAVEPVRVDVAKRAVALIIDFAAAYLVGVIVAFIPFVKDFLHLQLTMVLVLLSRDFFFEGRGIGKNLMGLQVVDVASGLPCSLFQSFQRNIILVAPFVVLQVVTIVTAFVPVAFINKTIFDIVNLVGMVYTAVVLPLEGYRAYSRADGLRFGDDLAGTAIVESYMDFSRFLPRQ